ncbi:MAG: hypothetical protein R2883_08725 [Caldisericia bacterium]
MAEQLGLEIGDSFNLGKNEVSVSGILKPTGSSDDAESFPTVELARELLDFQVLQQFLQMSNQEMLTDVSSGIEELTDAQPVTVTRWQQQSVGLLIQQAQFCLLSYLLRFLQVLQLLREVHFGIIEQSKLIGIQRSIKVSPLQVSFGVILQTLITTVFGGVAEYFWYSF